MPLAALGAQLAVMLNVGALNGSVAGTPGQAPVFRQNSTLAFVRYGMVVTLGTFDIATAGAGVIVARLSAMALMALVNTVTSVSSATLPWVAACSTSLAPTSTVMNVGLARLAAVTGGRPPVRNCCSFSVSVGNGTTVTSVACWARRNGMPTLCVTGLMLAGSRKPQKAAETPPTRVPASGLVNGAGQPGMRSAG